MLDKILYVVGKSDMPLQLVQSLLSSFLYSYLGKMIDSFHSLFKVEVIVYRSHKELFYPLP